MEQTDLTNVGYVDDNPEPRAPCLILADTSGSMDGEPIAALNRGLQTLGATLAEDSLAATRVEVSVVSFNHEVEVAQDWISACEFQAPTLAAEGTTSMGSGILKALEQIQARKDYLRQADRQWYRPWMILISDGLPTCTQEVMEQASAALRDAVARKKVLVFPVGVGEGANLEVLERITGSKALRLEGLRFEELFQWVSSSIGQVATADSLTDQVAFEPVDVWAAAEVS